MFDFSKYEVLSFDCYGTLIDWETGIIAALKPILSAHNITLDDEQILELYVEIESHAEEGGYVKYREVLRRVTRGIGSTFGFLPSPSELDCLVESLKDWMPFADSIESLQALKKRFKLAIISNIDDDLFAISAKHLKIEFDWIITAEHIKSYKPSLCNFQFAIEKIGVLPQKILHIAQSVYHDIIPAKVIGLSTVWVNRKESEKGFGTKLAAIGQPDLEVPDLKTLVSIILSN